MIVLESSTAAARRFPAQCWIQARSIAPALILLRRARRPIPSQLSTRPAITLPRRCTYVVASFDAAIKITLSATTVTYPLGTNVTISVASTHGHVPTGVVQLYDGTTLLQTSRLQGNGAAYLYIQGLAAGAHPLSVVYAGDSFNPGGTSAPVTLTVKPVPVNLTAACWNANFPYGADYHCGVYASSNCRRAARCYHLSVRRGDPR